MSEDERLIRNDPAIREIAQMVTNYCASCVELEARATAAEAENATLREALRDQVRWLEGIVGLDMNETAADGGVTVGMVVEQQVRTVFLPRARAALESRNVG